MRALLLNGKNRLFLILAIIIAVIPRVWLWFNYPLVYGNDTQTYIHLANNLRNNLGFSKYNGTRAPGYPFFIILTETEQNLYLTQLGMGIIVSVLIFFLTLRLTNSGVVSLIGSAAHSFNLGQIFFEASMLTEAVSTFLFFLCLTLLYQLLEQRGSRGLKNTLLILFLGLLSLVMASVRPQFLIFPFIAGLFLFEWSNRQAIIHSVGSVLLLVTPMIFALAAWVWFIYTRFNVVGLDAIGGYHIVNHTSSFFELAPQNYSQITEIFLKYREIRIAETGTSVNTIWDAIPELMETTKLNYYALGREMGTISNELIRLYPDKYLVNLVKGWFWFWKVGVFWDPAQLSQTVSRSALEVVMYSQRMFLILLNGIFLAGSLIHLLPRARQFLKPSRFTIFVIVFIWITSILQTFAEHGDNPRFLAPAQSLIVIVVLVWITRTLNWRKNARS